MVKVGENRLKQPLRQQKQLEGRHISNLKVQMQMIFYAKSLNMVKDMELIMLLIPHHWGCIIRQEVIG